MNAANDSIGVCLFTEFTSSYTRAWEHKLRTHSTIDTRPCDSTNSNAHILALHVRSRFLVHALGLNKRPASCITSDKISMRRRSAAFLSHLLQVDFACAAHFNPLKYVYSRPSFVLGYHLASLLKRANTGTLA